MAKLLGCRRCHVEMTKFALADGGVAVVCIACESFGLAHEVERGGPVWREQGAAMRKSQRDLAKRHAGRMSGPPGKLNSVRHYILRTRSNRWYVPTFS